MKQTVMILGTEYQIEIHKWSEDKELSQNSWAGYCCSEIPLIVIADLDDEEHFLSLIHIYPYLGRKDITVAHLLYDGEMQTGITTVHRRPH